MNTIRYWNDFALRLVANDHTGSPPPSNRGGPVQTSYALAMLHLALHDTVAKTGCNFKAYHEPEKPAPKGTSQVEALTGAFTEMAMALYPSHLADITEARDAIRKLLGSAGPYPNASEKCGISVAQGLLTHRKGDGTNAANTYGYSRVPGEHGPDPAQPGQSALGSFWGNVIPFTYPQGGHPGLMGPPALNDPAYLDAYKQVYQEGRENLWQTNPLQAMKGVFWGYDGSQKLGTPPRLYNQVVRAISDPLDLGVEDEIRLLTLINVGMADAGIACWFHKYNCNLWRPVLGIREQTGGAVPQDPFWLPLGLPNTNGSRIGNFTPGFPAYPSGHSTFGAVCFLLTAKFLRKEPKEVKFSFVSDEFNGINRDGNGVIRPLLKRDFTLASAIEENAKSRVYLGVHWNFDAKDGIDLAKDLICGIDQRFEKPRGPKPVTTESAPAAGEDPPLPDIPAQRQQMR
jgi:hypothetical protein